MDSPAPRFLIVDDNRMERLKLSRALEGQGYAVAAAESGPVALEMLRAEPFDLVFLDIVMPDMDGHQVLGQMKSEERLRAIPVIVVSGNDDPESVRRCIEGGAAAHLPKPVSAEALRDCVATCLVKGDPS